MTHTGAARLIFSCSHFAAVSLAELAQAIPPPNLQIPPSVGIRVGKGLTIDDTCQHLSFGDSPQVTPGTFACLYPACALESSTVSLMHCLHAVHAERLRGRPRDS